MSEEHANGGKTIRLGSTFQAVMTAEGELRVNGLPLCEHTARDLEFMLERLALIHLEVLQEIEAANRDVREASKEVMRLEQDVARALNGGGYW